MKEKKGNFLRWPWNVVIYVLLAVTLRLFAIPFILILIYAQQKNNPHGVEEGYCLSRTRKRISWVAWSVLWLAVAGALFYMFSVGFQQDRAYWERDDYVTLAVSGIGGALMLFLGLFMGYTGVKDTFFPEKSELAASIRSQMPYPEEAPPVGELFAMVDGDLKENGQWFGAVGIGKEWVLGDFVNRIDRIRGIFVVDEIRQRHSGNRTNTTRVLELVLIDDRWQKHVTDFKAPQDLRAAADCLTLKVPEARRGANGQWSGFLNMDDGQREDFEREFRRKQSLRASSQAQKEVMQGGTQDMILASGGEVTSRVSLSLVEEHLRHCLSGEEQNFTLTPTRPIEGTGGGFRAVRVSASDGTVWLGAEAADGSSVATKGMSGQEARRVLSSWLRREAPDVEGWETRRLSAPSLHNPRPQIRQTPPDELGLVLASGVAERHSTFTQEDVEAAAEGIVDGTYQMVKLSRPRRSQWMIVEAGDKSDGRCTVRAARADPDKLRFFSTKTTPRRAASWLLDYSTGKFLPGGADWKDYTKEVEKEK